MSYKLTQSGVLLRIEDGATIPEDPANADYQAFLAWAATPGNTPQPADPPPPAPDLSVVDNWDGGIRALALVVANFTGKTPAQVKSAFQTAFKALS
jgi:hypothetical protein